MVEDYAVFKHKIAMGQAWLVKAAIPVKHRVEAVDIYNDLVDAVESAKLEDIATCAQRLCSFYKQHKNFSDPENMVNEDIKQIISSFNIPAVVSVDGSKHMAAMTELLANRDFLKEIPENQRKNGAEIYAFLIKAVEGQSQKLIEDYGDQLCEFYREHKGFANPEIFVEHDIKTICKALGIENTNKVEFGFGFN